MKYLWLVLAFTTLAACGPQQASSEASRPPAAAASESAAQQAASPEQSPAITVSGPMTLSRNDLYPLLQENLFLSVQLVQGRYSEDWSPSPFMGVGWSGNFVLKVTDDSDRTINEFPLSNVFRDPLVYNSTFEIQFDDYNADGDIDFTLGQYGTSNGDFYKIFTLRSDRTIEELPIRGTPEMFISDGNSRYSTKLTKLSPVSFQKNAYDNSIGKTVVSTFQWEGDDFVRIEDKEE